MSQIKIYKFIFLTICFLVSTLNFAQNASINYSYDNLNRITNIDYQDGSTVFYNYDEVGNRTSTTIVLGPSASRTNLKAFLEGCYSSGQMLTLLNSSGNLPKDQPFNSEPWNYSGIESVTSFPSNIVDWVLIEIRTGPLENTKVSTRTALIRNDGVIVDLDGTSQVSFSSIEAGDYYIVLRHRNHLDIMSANPVTISSGSSTLYDFTTAQTKAYGTNPMKNIGSNVFGLYAGDIDADGNVDYASDLLVHWLPLFGYSGYYSEDINLNGDVDYAEDLLIYWLPNFGFSSQVPGTSLISKSILQKQIDSIDRIKDLNKKKIEKKE